MENALKEKFLSFSGFVFDMDGTIIDLENLNYERYRIAFKNLIDFDFKKEDYINYFSGKRGEESFPEFLGKIGLPNHGFSLLLKESRDLKNKMLKSNFYDVVSVKPFIREFLLAIKGKKKKVCLATSTPRKLTETILGKFEILGFF